MKGSSQGLIDVGLDRFWRHKDGGLNRWKGSWRFPVVTHHSRTRLRPQSPVRLRIRVHGLEEERWRGERKEEDP